MLLIAHASHYEGILILAPITIVFSWLAFVRLRDRVRARRGDVQPAEPATAGPGASDSTSGP